MVNSELRLQEARSLREKLQNLIISGKNAFLQAHPKYTGTPLSYQWIFHSPATYSGFPTIHNSFHPIPDRITTDWTIEDISRCLQAIENDSIKIRVRRKIWSRLQVYSYTRNRICETIESEIGKSVITHPHWSPINDDTRVNCYTWAFSEKYPSFPDGSFSQYIERKYAEINEALDTGALCVKQYHQKSKRSRQPRRARSTTPSPSSDESHSPRREDAQAIIPNDDSRHIAAPTPNRGNQHNTLAAKDTCEGHNIVRVRNVSTQTKIITLVTTKDSTELFQKEIKRSATLEFENDGLKIEKSRMSKEKSELELTLTEMKNKHEEDLLKMKNRHEEHIMEVRNMSVGAIIEARLEVEKTCEERLPYLLESQCEDGRVRGVRAVEAQYLAERSLIQSQLARVPLAAPKGPRAMGEGRQTSGAWRLEDVTPSQNHSINANEALAQLREHDTPTPQSMAPAIASASLAQASLNIVPNINDPEAFSQQLLQLSRADNTYPALDITYKFDSSFLTTVLGPLNHVINEVPTHITNPMQWNKYILIDPSTQNYMKFSSELPTNNGILIHFLPHNPSSFLRGQKCGVYPIIVKSHNTPQNRDSYSYMGYFAITTVTNTNTEDFKTAIMNLPYTHVEALRKEQERVLGTGGKNGDVELCSLRFAFFAFDQYRLLLEASEKFEKENAGNGDTRANKRESDGISVVSPTQAASASPLAPGSNPEHNSKPTPRKRKATAGSDSTSPSSRKDSRIRRDLPSSSSSSPAAKKTKTLNYSQGLKAMGIS